jgi:hypothetical protein
MLSNAPIRAYISASNIPRARKFYEQIVGLKPKEEYAGGVICQRLASSNDVIPSEAGGPAFPVPCSGEFISPPAVT